LWRGEVRLRRYNLAVFDSLLLDDFLGHELRAEVEAEFRAAPSFAAGVYGVDVGAAVDARVRHAQLVEVNDRVRDLVRRRLLDEMPRLGEHFGIALHTCEEPQFLRYEVGGFFVAHQDGNTPLIHDDTRHRRVSGVVFINPSVDTPSDGCYGGGSLILHGRYPDWQRRYVVPPAAGTFVAFRAETTHEVTPVTHGTRFTIAAFYR
jgi:SM-20-related protein